MTDGLGRLILYRAYGNKETAALNELAIANYNWLETLLLPTYRAGHPKQPRGPFPVWSFGLHASYVQVLDFSVPNANSDFPDLQKPQMSAFFRDNKKIAEEYAQRSKPIVALANGERRLLRSPNMPISSCSRIQRIF